MSMAKFFRNKLDLVFWLIAVFVFAALLVYAIYVIKFLVGEFYAATNPNLIKQQEIVRFSLNKIKNLR